MRDRPSMRELILIVALLAVTVAGIGINLMAML